MSHPVIAAWHQVVDSRDPAGLDALLADDAVFHSPVVHTPQAGKALTRAYLSAAMQVLTGEGWRYVREVVSGQDAVLEFETVLEGVRVNGVDLIRWDDQGRITDFKVMIRPLKAIEKVHALMAQQLAARKG